MKLIYCLVGAYAAFLLFYDDVKTMDKDVLDILFPFLSQTEDVRFVAYDDGVGNMTIGIGHLIKANETHLLKKKLTLQEVKDLFVKDVKWAYAYVNKTFPKFNVYQKAALTSFYFGTGYIGDGFMLALRSGSAEQIKAAWRKYRLAKDKKTGQYIVMGGLVTRREKEIKLFFT